MTEIENFDYLTCQIKEGLGPDYFVEFYNKLLGYKMRTEFLGKTVEPELTQQLARLVELYPDAEKISEEMRIARVKYRNERLLK